MSIEIIWISFGKKNSTIGIKCKINKKYNRICHSFQKIWHFDKQSIMLNLSKKKSSKWRKNCHACKTLTTMVNASFITYPWPAVMVDVSTGNKTTDETESSSDASQPCSFGSNYSATGSYYLNRLTFYNVNEAEASFITYPWPAVMVYVSTGNNITDETECFRDTSQPRSFGRNYSTTDSNYLNWLIIPMRFLKFNIFHI